MEGTPLKTEQDGQLEEDPRPGRFRTRRFRTRLLWATAAVSVIAAGGAALSGVLPGVPLRAGPLEGVDGVYASLPVRPADTGVLWGILVLENPSGTPIVLDSVKVTDNPEQLPLLRSPYIWDESRTDTLGFNGTDGHQLPLPADWRLPPERKVSGYILKPATPEPSDQAEVTGQHSPSANVLFEFAPPKRPTKLSGITVDYHIGSLAYQRTFDTSIVLCPIDDLGPCDAVTE